MITLHVILENKNYRLPNAASEKEHPTLQIIKKGIASIFHAVELDFPGQDILVIWNEDSQELNCHSQTIERAQLAESLIRHHGITI
ncbi:MAG: hypothetical protein JST58_06785 [Bacteroidetes bacterium]|nr:hypothetical protein [Bacteroidota bacterium]